MICKLIHNDKIIFDSSNISEIIRIDWGENIIFIRKLTNKNNFNDKDIYKKLYSIPIESILYVSDDEDTCCIYIR